MERCTVEKPLAGLYLHLDFLKCASPLLKRSPCGPCCLAPQATLCPLSGPLPVSHSCGSLFRILRSLGEPLRWLESQSRSPLETFLSTPSLVEVFSVGPCTTLTLPTLQFRL
jgi:hypothetical protein